MSLRHFWDYSFMRAITTCFDFASSGERSFGDSFGLSWHDPLTLLDEASQFSYAFALTCAPAGEAGVPFRVSFRDLGLPHDFLTGPGFASPSADPRGCRNFLGGTGGGAAGNSGGTLLFSVDSFLSALTTSGRRAPRHLTINLMTSCDSFSLLTQSSRVMCVTGMPSIEST